MSTIPVIRRERKTLPPKSRTRKPAEDRFPARKARAAAEYSLAARRVQPGSIADIVSQVLAMLMATRRCFADHVAAERSRLSATLSAVRPVSSYLERGELRNVEHDELGFSLTTVGQIARAHWERDRRNPLALGRVVR